MRKILALALIVCILVSITGCYFEKREISDPVNFYYVTPEITFNTDNGYIVAEKRDVMRSATDLTQLINLYLAGPESDTFRSPFPSNTSVKNITHTSGILSIVLSDSFAALEGFDLSVACACLTITIQELVETQLVQISAENTQLDGNRSITMSKDSLVLLDSVDADS